MIFSYKKIIWLVFYLIFCLFVCLRAKITELAAEIAKMQKEVDQFNQENATFLTYEKRYDGFSFLNIF